MMAQVQRMITNLPEIWECLRTNTWPERFLQVTMGLSDARIAMLPQLAQLCMILYFTMAGISLILHFGKKQYSFSTIRRKLTDFALMVLMPLIIRIVVVIFRVGQELTAAVEGSFSFTSAGVDWLGKMVSTWFFPMALCLIFLVIALIPAFTVKKYLIEYKLAGVAWAVYDVGFGVVCLSAAVLSMSAGDPRWYWSVGVAAILVLLGQTGGVVVD